MIQCKSCDEWYHQDCVDIEIINDIDLDQWRCCYCDPYIAFINRLEKEKKSNNTQESESGPPVLEEHNE